MSKFSCKILSHLCTMVYFYYLLDIIRCNALSLLAIKHDKSLKKVNSFEIGFELVMSLVKPFVAGRSINGLSITQQNKMSIILGRHVGTANDQPNHDGFEFTRFGLRQRCHTCLRDISGNEHKKKKDNLYLGYRARLIHERHTSSNPMNVNCVTEDKEANLFNVKTYKVTKLCDICPLISVN